MRVILRENVENLGSIGDLVRVSAGYARNYLLPRKLVAIADESNVRALEHERRVLEKRRQEKKSQSEALAAKIASHSCTISRKVGEKDQLFGSVTTADIAAAMKASGLEIDKRAISMADPIKTLGVHTVTVKIQPEVSAPLKVWVVKEE